MERSNMTSLSHWGLFPVDVRELGLSTMRVWAEKQFWKDADENYERVTGKKINTR